MFDFRNYRSLLLGARYNDDPLHLHSFIKVRRIEKWACKHRPEIYRVVWENQGAPVKMTSWVVYPFGLNLYHSSSSHRATRTARTGIMEWWCCEIQLKLYLQFDDQMQHAVVILKGRSLACFSGFWMTERALATNCTSNTREQFILIVTRKQAFVIHTKK
jgi:hypothetical protein